MAKEVKEKWFLKAVIKAVIIIVALTVVASLILKGITQHNKEIEVPNLNGLSIGAAQTVAQQSEVRIEVTDSVYMKRLPRGSVFSQKPAAGSHVKKGRRILLTINAVEPKKVKMPNLVGYSLRQAKTVLLSKGLKVGKLIYKEDIATDNVLGQQIKGKEISAGKEIETESQIDLILGLDPNNSTTFVPHLAGYKYDIAADNITEHSLNVGTVRYDETVKTFEDSTNAVVYKQSPEYDPEAPCPMGTPVDISLTVSQAKLTSFEQ